jgi:hypothetical protein
MASTTEHNGVEHAEDPVMTSWLERAITRETSKNTRSKEREGHAMNVPPRAAMGNSTTSITSACRTVDVSVYSASVGDDTDEEADGETSIRMYSNRL